MNITEINITLTPLEVRKKDRVLAFVRLVIENSLLIRDIKIMEKEGYLQLAMPSRKIVIACSSCKRKVALNDKYCAFCGDSQPAREVNKRPYVDTTHPVNPTFRRFLEEKVCEEYNNLVKDDEKLKVR